MKKHSCDVPAFDRLNYYYGQVLGHAELQLEQDYLRNKLQLLNRCLHGYGVVCGYEVVLVPPPHDCDPKQPPPPRVCVKPGIALDCEGRELVLREAREIDLWSRLTPDEQRELETCEHATVYITVCYCETSFSPSRPAIPDACSAVSACRDGKTREDVRLRVSLRPPEEDHRCNGCCSCCSDPCLLLAKIERFHPKRPLDEHAVDDGVRRMVGPYEYATIAEINFVQGGTYSQEDAHHLLKHHGVRVRFSRKVRKSTIVDGVLDLYVIEDNDNRLADIQSIKGTIHIPGDPHDEYTDVVYFRQASNEILQVGDRVLFTLRSAFVLDECCEPVDGEHIGGRVPCHSDGCDDCWHPPAPDHHACRHPPKRHGRWRSGNGTGGGTFEAWFFVGRGESEEPNMRGPRGRRQ